jgi:putative ABC transport system permease protein
MLNQRLKFGLRRLFQRSQAERELDEEIRAHLAMAAQERLDRGEAPVDAQQNARRELGNELLIKETTRDMWGPAPLESLVKDMRYILRQIKRSQVFSAATVLTLALGLGGTTTMFSIVNGVLLKPLGFRDPDRLYLARTLPPARSGLTGEFPVNARHFHEWRTHCRSCEAVSLVRYDEITLIGAGDPALLPTYTISFNFFRTLGVQPSLGRDFLPEEELPGHWGEVILTDALWRSRFAADPSIIGRTIQINGESSTVVGVMPPELHLPKGDEWGPFFGPQKAPLIFRPLGIDASRARPVGNMNYTAVVRLKPGVGKEEAKAELNALLADFVRTYKLETTTTLIPLEQQVIRRARSALWILLGAVGAVLLIACANVGNLMLVRTTSRYREAGVRLALGASRGQLFGLALKESLVLVAIGGGLGLALAALGLKWLAASAPISLPRIEEVQIDWRVLGFAALTTGFSTIACGLFPAWQLSRTEPLESIKAASSTGSPGGLPLRDTLITVEVALSTTLLITGGLLMLSFLRVMRVEKGFEVAHIITQDVSFLNPKYRDEARTRFLDDVLRKLDQIPGVESAAAINQLPLIGEDWVDELQDPDQPPHSVENAALANFRFVTPDYWRAMGIPLKRGRFLDESDRNRARVLISERAAQYLWPNQNPIGKHVRGAMKGRQNPSLEVVGVVGEVRAAGLEQTHPTMMVYEHYERMKPIGMSITVRARANPTPVAAAVRAILSSADPEMAISQTRTMEQILVDSVAPRKFQMDLAVGFAIAALMLASLGIYGVISFAVAQRTPEIGIRIALGAQGTQVVAMVMRRAMLPVFAGIAAGLAGALLTGRFLASQLFGVSPHDPRTILTVVAALLAAAISACWAPAHRAARIDPMRALRFE